MALINRMEYGSWCIQQGKCMRKLSMSLWDGMGMRLCSDTRPMTVGCLKQFLGCAIRALLLLLFATLSSSFLRSNHESIRGVGW